jgi:hypothetical protein
VRIHPDQAERLAVDASNPVGTGSHGAGGQAVITAQDQRYGVGLQRRETARVQRAAHGRDRLDVLLVAIERVFCFGNRRGQIAFVDHLTSELRDRLANSGDADRRRPHIHAATGTAEIEWNADDVDRFHGRDSSPT